MTISSLLARSYETAALLFGISGCVLFLTPKGLRAWEENLAVAAISACENQGGIALVGADQVVSCAPTTPASGSAP